MPLPILRAPLAALLVWAALPAAPALACEQAWFLRNLIAHRSGYCFATPLGRALFDNTGCVPGPLRLSAEDMARVQAIRAMERAEGCAVNTSATELPHGGTDWDWHLIETIPVPTPHESGCIGYRLDPIPLRAAPRAEAAVVGQVRRGVSIGFNYEGENGWTFVVTDAAEGYMGWMPDAAMSYDEDACEGWAG